MLCKEVILRHFRDRSSTGDDLLHRAAHPLVGMIVEERGLSDVNSLMQFVEEPENLRPWLPSRNDRVWLSGAIRQGLQELSRADKTNPRRNQRCCV